MANEINWDDYGTPIATEEPPADTGYGDLNFLNSLVGGRLSQAITPEPIPDRYNSPVNWDQYGTPIDEQQTQDQPNEGTAQQPEAQPQVEDAPRQQAKLDRIAQTRARLEAQDAARAQPDENYNPEKGAAPSDAEHLNLADEALLGAAQGVANVGRQVGGAVRSLGPQSAVGGLLTFFGGAQKVGKAISDYSTEQAKQFQEEGQADPTAKTGKMINWLASSATGLAPIVVAGAVGGLPLVAATMGAQSFGGTYENAIERYQQDGLSEEEAARKAYFPAVISGAVSAAIGHAVGPTGLGALANKALAGTTIRQIVGSILKDAGLGGAQGFTDTFAQGIIQKATYDPERSWSEIVPDALESGAGGALLGGLASGVHQALGAFSRAAQGEPPVIPERQPIRIPNPTVPTPQVELPVPSVDQPNRITPPIQAPQQVPEVVNPTVPAPEAKPITLPKINVPERIAVQVDQHLASEPAALPELHNLVNAEISEKPLVQVFDNLPSVVDQVVKNPAQATPEQLQAAQAALTDALAKVQAIDLPKAQLKQASDPLLQILNDLKAHEQGQEDVLYHGTNRAFDKFGETALGNAGKARGQAVGRYYFSEDPESAARVGEAGGYKLVSVDEWAANHDLEHNDPEALTTLRTALQEAIDKGKRVAYMQDDGDYVWAKKSDDLKTYEELDSARVYNPSRMPRLLKATIGGRTLDLRKPYEQWPDTLRKVVPKPGNLSFYWHDSAPALYQWAKDNGYSKINVIDSYESGGKSVIVLPHAIGKFEEIESAGFPKERRHEQPPIEPQSQAQPVAQSEAGRSAEQVSPEPNVNPGASATSGIASAGSEPVQPIAQPNAQRTVAAGVERPPDIIDQIVDNYGTILAKSSARKGTEGYYGDMYTSVRDQRPRLFTAKGISPDRVVDSLRRDGLVKQDFTVDDLWDAIDQAHKARTAHFRGELPEQKADKFHQLLIDANKAKKHYVVSVGDLEVGTRFKIKGELFTVKNIDPDDGSVQVQDGPKFGHQVIPDGADIPVQKGTLKIPNKPLSVDQAWPDVHGSLAKGWTEASGETDQGPKESKYWLRFDPKEVVRGHDALRQMVNAPDSGVTGIALKAFNALLDNPNLRDLFGSIGVAVHDGGIGFSGLADITNGILHLSKSFATVETASHEVFHFVYDRLPNFMKQQVEASRLAALEKHFNGNIPPEFRNGMSSVEWKSKGLSSDTYSLINASEHLATFAGEKLGKESVATKPTTFSGKIAATVRNWIQSIADTFSRLTGQQYDLGRVVREVLSGKINLGSESDIGPQEPHASYVDTAARAKRAEEIAVNDDERIREGHNMASQHQEHLDALLRAGASKTDEKVQRLLGINNKIGIVTKAAEILGKNMGYAEAKSHMDPISQRINANYAAAAYEAADRHLRNLTSKAKEAEAEISAPGFLKKVDKQFLDSFKIEANEDAQSKAKSMLTTVLNVAKQVNKDKSLSDVEQARLQGQLQEVTEAGKSSSALSGLVQDMTRVLASTPEGLALLENGGSRAQFRSVYADLKRSADQPLHSNSLMNWASYLMAKAPRLREKLLASELASDPNVKVALNTFQEKFLKAYQKDPTKAVMAEVRAANSLAGNAAKAKFAWKIANEPLLKKFQNAQDFASAAEIAGKALNDPAIVQLRQEIRKDSQSIGSQERASTKAPFDPKSDIVFPSGRTVSLAGKSFDGEFNKVRTEAVAGLKEIDDFLANNPPGAENYDYYLRARQTLHETLLSGSALKSNDPLKVHNSTFGILWNTLYTSGGRLANALKGTWARAEQIGQRAQHWATKWAPETTRVRLAAINSHKIKFGVGRDLNFVQAHELWWKQVGNELAYSGNRQAGAYEVGDEIGTLGWKVTRQDMDAIKSQTLATEEGYEASGDRQIALDTTAGKGAHLTRTAAKPGVFGTVRDSNRDAAPFADDMGKGYQAYRAAKTDAERAAILDKMDQSFSENFADHGKAYTLDRTFNLIGDQPTPLDGRDGAFQAVLPMITDGRVSTTQEYWQALADASGHSIDEVKAIVLSDLGRMADNWNKVFTSDEKVIREGSGHETKNSFSLARERAVAPYSFYNYGFHDGNALRGFAAHIYSRSFDEVLNGLDALVQDLERMKLDRNKKINAELAKGNMDARKTVEARQNHDRAMDQSFDNYNDIENRIRKAKQMKERLNRHDTVTIPEGIVLRGVQDLTGASLGTVAAFNDIVMNPYYLGRSVLRIKGGYGKAAILTAAADFDSKIRLAASVVYSGIKGGLNLLLADPGETLAGAHTGSKGMFSGGLIGAGLHIPMDRSLALFVNRLVIPFVHEWGDNLHTRMWSTQKMVQHGIDPVSSVAVDVSNRIMGGLASAGEIRGDPNARPNALGVGIHNLMGAWEILAKSVINSTYRLNDTTMNQNARNVYDGWIGSRIGPTAQFTDALKQVAVRIKEDGRKWNREKWDDPVNELSPKEMFGSKTATRSDKYRAIDAHDRAGIDYRRLAHEAINQYAFGDGKFKPYDEAKTYRLVHELALYENKQSKINESQVLKNNSFVGRLLKPYQSWSTRQLSNFDRMSEIADSVTHGKSESQARRAQVIGFMGVALNLMALVGAGALVTVGANAARRVFMKALFNHVTAAPQPWERKGTAAQAKGWALAGLNTIPYIGTIANAMFDDLATRAAYDPSVAMLEKLKTMGQYVGGAIQSKDPFYRLPETIGSLVPDSKILLNRLESESGKRENINEANLLRRYADPDTVKPIGGRNFQVTPLTPYGAKMVNAAVNGDAGKLQQIRDEAVQVARDMGKPDPEKAVEQMFRNQMAETKALKNKQTQEQRDAFLGQLTPGEREIVDRVDSNYSAGAQALGMNAPSLVKEPAQGSSGSRVSRVNVGPSRLGFNRIPRIRGLSRIKRTRVARAPRARRSLARSGRRLRTFA